MAMPYANPFGGSGGGASLPGLPGMDMYALGRYYLNQTPVAAYYNYLLGNNLGGTDPRSKYAQSQQDRIYNYFLADQPQHPNWGFNDYLENVGHDFNADYMGLGPQARGDYTSGSLTPRARWITR